MKFYDNRGEVHTSRMRALLANIFKRKDKQSTSSVSTDNEYDNIVDVDEYIEEDDEEEDELITGSSNINIDPLEESVNYTDINGNTISTPYDEVLKKGIDDKELIAQLKDKK